MMNESDDVEYQAERQNALEAEKARQQRIRDKVPGRRTNGKARAGDIDGTSFVVQVFEGLLPRALSCSGSSQRRLGIYY